jgi:hypothetical protein
MCQEADKEERGHPVRLSAQREHLSIGSERTSPAGGQDVRAPFPK